MTNEQKLFLTAVKDHIQGTPTAPVAGLDWGTLYGLSQSHQMTAIVYAQCKAFIPDEQSGRFRSAYMHVVYANTRRRHLTQQIADGFRAKNIPFFLVKGAEIARYYPQSLLRTMGDADVVVADRETADQVMTELGFQCVEHTDEYEWVYRKDGLDYEIHDRLVQKRAVENGEKKEIVSFFADPWPFSGEQGLDLNYHFLFLLFHLRRHMMGHGVGFRQFADVAVTVRNADGLDWPWITAQLENIGMREFADTVFAMIARWFGVIPPIEVKETDDGFFEEATAYVFGNGVFGFQDTDHVIDSKMRTIMLYENTDPGTAKRRRFFRNVFPSYERLRRSGKYPYLDRGKFLLPLAWFQNGAEGLVFKLTHKKDRARAATMTEDTVRRVQLLRQWGV